MKKLTAILLFLLTVMSCLGFAAVAVGAEQAPVFEYSIENDEVTIVRAVDPRGDVFVPTEIEDFPVTVIAYNAFLGCESVKSVTLPDSVKEIGDGAFEDCVSLYEINVGSGVESIGDGVFTGCISLRSIKVNGANQRYYSKGNCLIDAVSRTIVVGCNKSVIPADGSVTAIGYRAFDDCSFLTSLVIPFGVESIGECAFSNCVRLENPVIPESVETIGDHAFENCTALFSLEIPKSVKSVGDWAFYGCENLRNVSLPEGIIFNNPGVFYNTPFYNELIKNSGGVRYLNDLLFDADRGLAGRYSVKQGTKNISGFAFAFCNMLESVEVSEGVIAVGRSAFEMCLGLKAVYLPDSLRTIGDFAFAGCSELKTVDIPDRVSYIGNYAFWGCSSIEELMIPCGVSEIGEGAFNDCRSLKTVFVPDSVIEINETAFSGCGDMVMYVIAGSYAESFAEEYSIPFVSLVNYNDLPDGAWHYVPCYWCSRKGFMTGTAEGEFSPEQRLTRAQLVQILAKVAGVELDEVKYDGRFVDVPSGQWYSKAVSWAVANGITGGIGNGMFAPNAPVSRQQLAVFISAFATATGNPLWTIGNIAVFDDYTDIAPWARTAMAYAYGEGLIGGMGDNTLAPEDLATRGQTAAVIRKYFEHKR